MKQFIFILFIGLLCFGLQAQPIRSSTYAQLIDKAEELVELQDYYNAISQYNEAYRMSSDSDITAEIAYLNYLVKDYKRAESTYNRLLKRDADNIYLEERYFYGKVLKASGKYNEAFAEFEKYLEFGTDDELKALIDLEIRGMQLAGQVEQNVGTVVTFAKGKVNSAFQEYGPRLHKSGDLYFSGIPAKKAVKTIGAADEQYSRIYVTKKNGEEYDKPEPLDRSINRPGYHTGNVAFTKDGNSMYFTRSKLFGNELDESLLYLSTYDGEQWTPANPVPNVNGEHIITHPVVGELFGNDVLFFTSDMAGGIGAYDIFYSTINGDGSLSAPVNLGPTINTTGDDAYPYYFNGSLYFSSMGRPGLGGYDIFSSDWDGVNWSDPTNLGLNYNTSYDDMGISFDATGENGYLVSNRPDEDKKTMKSKTCCDDIYEFNIRQLVIDLAALVEDPNGELPGATMTLIDESEAKGPESKTNDKGNSFSYLLDTERSYRIITTKEGYYPDTSGFNTVGILDDFTINKTVVLQPIPIVVEPAEPEFETVTINQTIRLNKIYYDFEKWDILPEAENDLNILLNLMNEYPEMVIELSSHTDSRGGKVYNNRLSQKRAESAANWLTERGVDVSRIKPVGYGETVILNQCTNGKRCSDEDHRFNRRTEFKIIEGPQEIRITKEILKGAVKQGE